MLVVCRPTSTVLHSLLRCALLPRSLGSGLYQRSVGGGLTLAENKHPMAPLWDGAFGPSSDTVSLRTRRTSAGGAASEARLSSPAQQGDAVCEAEPPPQPQGPTDHIQTSVQTEGAVAPQPEEQQERGEKNCTFPVTGTPRVQRVF